MRQHGHARRTWRRLPCRRIVRRTMRVVLERRPASSTTIRSGSVSAIGWPSSRRSVEASLCAWSCARRAQQVVAGGQRGVVDPGDQPAAVLLRRQAPARCPSRLAADLDRRRRRARRPCRSPAPPRASGRSATAPRSRAAAARGHSAASPAPTPRPRSRCPAASRRHSDKRPLARRRHLNAEARDAGAGLLAPAAASRLQRRTACSRPPRSARDRPPAGSSTRRAKSLLLRHSSPPSTPTSTRPGGVLSIRAVTGAEVADVAGGVLGLHDERLRALGERRGVDVDLARARSGTAPRWRRRRSGEANAHGRCCDAAGLTGRRSLAPAHADVVAGVVVERLGAAAPTRRAASGVSPMIATVGATDVGDADLGLVGADVVGAARGARLAPVAADADHALHDPRRAGDVERA